MNQPNIEPHRITKPIQLLAAWLAGLAIVNSSFLLTAAHLTSPTWIPAMLSIAAVVNVPLFIVSLFLLQTKFRPEMQEDAFYSRYLEQSSKVKLLSSPNVDIEAQVRQVTQRVTAELGKKTATEEQRIETVLKEAAIENLKKRFEPSRTISELYLLEDKFHEVVDSWGTDNAFLEEVRQLTADGLATMDKGSLLSLRLTPIGKEVARRIDESVKLWNKRNDRIMSAHGSKKTL